LVGALASRPYLDENAALPVPQTYWARLAASTSSRIAARGLCREGAAPGNVRSAQAHSARARLKRVRRTPLSACARRRPGDIAKTRPDLDLSWRSGPHGARRTAARPVRQSQRRSAPASTCHEAPSVPTVQLGMAYRARDGMPPPARTGDREERPI